jgi:hypothetical protein
MTHTESSDLAGILQPVFTAVAGVVLAFLAWLAGLTL